MYTEKIKQNLRTFHQIKLRRDQKNPTVRNYGVEVQMEELKEYERQVNEQRKAAGVEETQDVAAELETKLVENLSEFIHEESTE